MPACIWQMWRATARHSFVHAHTHTHAYSNSHSDPDANSYANSYTNSYTNSFAIFIFCCRSIFVHKRYSVFFQLFTASTLWLINPVFQRSMWKHDHVRWLQLWTLLF